MGDVPIPNDWEGEYCRYAVCWPRSPEWLAILRGLLYLGATGRYYLASTGSVIGAQAVILETLDYNFRQEEVLMACGDSGLADGLLAIAAALNNQTAAGGAGGCCGGSTGGAGQFPPDPGGVNTGGTDPFTDPPPDGYPSWDVFEAQRCGEAHFIVDDMELSLAHIQILLITGLSVESVVELMLVALTLTLSSAGVAAVAALVVTVGSTIIASTALSIINENEVDLICALLSGSDSVTSRNAFLEKFNELADAASVDIVETAFAKMLVSYLLETSETNRMYTPNTAIDYSGYDCSECPQPTPCWDWENALDQTDGWFAPAPLFPGWGEPALDSSVSWQAGYIELDPQETGCEASENVCGSMSSPEFSYLIKTGDQICINISGYGGAGPSWNGYVGVKISGTDIGLWAGTGDIIGIAHYDLSDYADQELTFIYLGVSQPSGEAAPYVRIQAICITAETC